MSDGTNENELMSFDNEKQSNKSIEEIKDEQTQEEANEKKTEENVVVEKKIEAKTNKKNKNQKQKKEKPTTKKVEGIALDNKKGVKQVSSTTDHSIVNTNKSVSGARISGNNISTNTWN